MFNLFTGFLPNPFEERRKVKKWIEQNTEVGKVWREFKDDIGIGEVEEKMAEFRNETKNFFGFTIEPKVGSLFFCHLTGNFKHVGIYIGEGKIVELTGEGKVACINFNEFLNYSEMRIGETIQTLVDIGREPVTFENAVKRAKSMIGKNIGYDLLSSNCYTFVWGCVSGDFNNNCLHYADLYMKITAKEGVVRLEEVSQL